MSSYTDKKWRPTNTGQYDRHGEGDLLRQALLRVGALGAKPIEDSGGICAYRTAKTIIVAKNDTYGNLVSVAEHLVRRAKDAGLWIVMYLGRAGEVYQFDPEEIENHTEFKNFYGLEAMRNFNIGIGRRIL